MGVTPERFIASTWPNREDPGAEDEEAQSVARGSGSLGGR